MLEESKLLRVLVVDDSPVNRSCIIDAVQDSKAGRVVGTACDGTEALRLVHQLQPDVITLDLEMPRMDGFSFLRLLMATRPVPVLVISSYAQKENVFRALELGALDFVAKGDATEDRKLREVIRQKLEAVDSVQHKRISVQPGKPSKPDSGRPVSDKSPPPRYIVAIGSSTGGPTAVTEILSRLSSKPHYSVLVAQHMPAKFTTTFAQRLNRYSSLRVSEAKEGEVVSSGMALVCPGSHCMELERRSDGEIIVRLSDPTLQERYVPNASRLLASTAKVMGPRAIGVVLTGMGDDGAEGARHIEERGGTVIVESEESAVVYGMPRAAARVVSTSRSVGLSGIAGELLGLVGYRQ